jgi:hypothetical protein
MVPVGSHLVSSLSLPYLPLYRDDSFHTAGNQSYIERFGYIGGSNQNQALGDSNHSLGLGDSNHSLSLDQLGNSNQSQVSQCIDHSRRYSAASPLAPLSTLSRPNGSNRSLSSEASSRKRSRFLPVNADDFFQSFPTLTLVTDTDAIQEEQDDERDVEAASDLSSVSSTDSSGSPSAQRQRKPSVMLDVSDGSMCLAQLIAEMEDELSVKKKDKAELKKWEEDQGHKADDGDSASHDKGNKDDMYVSDSDSASSIDVHDESEKRLRRGFFFPILWAIAMCGLGGLVGKLCSWFQETDAADIAADMVEEVQEEAANVASRMLFMQQASQNSSSSLVVAGPIPIDGGANQM